MLTFEEKTTIIETFPELSKKEVSMKRVNYHYEQSLYEKKTVVYHLHPNGNGFVYVGDLPQYNPDDRGYVNIREASEEELRNMLSDSIRYLSEYMEPEEIEEIWLNGHNHKLTLLEEDGFFNIYHGYNLEESFGTYDDASGYLREEGFSKQ